MKIEKDLKGVTIQHKKVPTKRNSGLPPLYFEALFNNAERSENG